MGKERASGGQYFRILTDRVRAREFQSLFLFVTSRCNARCRTCFYFEKLNRRDDLTFDEIARLSETAPPFRKLWISGGEPFLRDELADILAMFVRRNGVRNINLPTNGLLPDRIFRGAKEFADLVERTDRSDLLNDPFALDRPMGHLVGGFTGE